MIADMRKSRGRFGEGGVVESSPQSFAGRGRRKDINKLFNIKVYMFKKTRCSTRQKLKFWNSFKYGCSQCLTRQNTENFEFRLRKWKVDFFHDFL